MSVIVDTDPGVDDALAIMLAVKSGLDIIGITTTYGNSTVENSTKNALVITELLQADIPVYSGARQPLRGGGRLAQSHGDNGMGGWEAPTRRTAESADAVTFLAGALRQSHRPVDIVAIGPLTNVARLLDEYPESAAKIGQLVIMGGVFEQRGNVTEYAEFNAYNDPAAFDIVLNAPIKRVIVPANVCRKVMLSDADLAVASGVLAADVRQLARTYIDYYTQATDGQFDGGVLYDVLAVMYILDKRVFTTCRRGVVVDTCPGPMYGQTTWRPGGAMCSVVTDVDAPAVKWAFLRAVLLMAPK